MVIKETPRAGETPEMKISKSPNVPGMGKAEVEEVARLRRRRESRNDKGLALANDLDRTALGESHDHVARIGVVTGGA